MAQYRKDLQIIDDSPQRFEVVMIADKFGNLTSDSQSTHVDASRSISGISDVLTLAITSFGNSTKIASLLGWSELI